jgi:hypothetical protein
MKTAMELALARIEMLYIEKDSIHWEMFKNDCMEKEKEQIIDAFKSARNIQDSDDISITHDWVSAEQYYNQTYNQNK